MNEAEQGSEARANDLRRGRLAALGRTVESISDLKATVQRDTGTWFLKVGVSYTGDSFTVVLCDLVAGVWDFNFANGERVGPADDVRGCAQVVRAAARGVSVVMSVESEQTSPAE